MSKGVPRSSTRAGWPRPGSAGIPQPSPSDVVVPPMPTTLGAGREEPSAVGKRGMNIQRLGQMSVNPGKPGKR